MIIRPVSSEAVPWSLLLLADPSRERVADYLNAGVTFVGELDGEPVAVAVIACSGGCCELKNIAVAESLRGRGLGGQLLRYVFQHAAESGAESITVGTGNSSAGPLAFYQRHGFRITGVIPGFFESYEPPIVENGIRCIDMIRLAFEIKR